MLRICTWNVGCFYFLKYAKHFGIKFKNQKIIHQYFQPKINGDFVSKNLEKINPDIIFLQEIFTPKDIQSIDILNDYPYKKLVSSWYHKHSILVASKNDFKITETGHFSMISYNDINYVPIHLNAFSGLKRMEDAVFFNELAENTPNLIIIGDSNIWSRRKHFLFKNDRKAYKILTQKLKDFSKQLLSTTYEGISLDKIFGSKNIHIKHMQSPKTRSYFMDHYPVFFDISDTDINN